MTETKQCEYAVVKDLSDEDEKLFGYFLLKCIHCGYECFGEIVFYDKDDNEVKLNGNLTLDETSGVIYEMEIYEKDEIFEKFN